MGDVLELRFVIRNDAGLHARAATGFARTAARYDAAIHVERAGLTVDGKRVMDVLLLMAAAGDEIRVRAQGRDAQAALAALTALVTRELGARLPDLVAA